MSVIEPTGSVPLRGTTVRYWGTTNGHAETVLALHGLGGDHRGLAELADGLTGFNVVIPDLPGYGTSAPMTCPHTLTNYADAIAEFRAALGLTSCHLLGHSLGASIALVHAARHGGLSSLTLLNPVSTASNMTANLGKLYYRLAAVLPRPVARFWLTSKPAVYVADAFVIKTKDRARRRWILQQDYENYAHSDVAAMVESFLSYYETPFEECAGGVSAPVLVTTGRRDGIAPVDVVRGLASRLGGRLVVSPDGGHLAPMETPLEVASLVRDFLSEIRPAAA